jgi:hypothetical protein
LSEDHVALHAQRIEPSRQTNMQAASAEARRRQVEADGSLVSPGAFCWRPSFRLAARIDRWVLALPVEWVQVGRRSQLSRPGSRHKVKGRSGRLPWFVPRDYRTD